MSLQLQMHTPYMQSTENSRRSLRHLFLLPVCRRFAQDYPRAHRDMLSRESKSSQFPFRRISSDTHTSRPAIGDLKMWPSKQIDRLYCMALLPDLLKLHFKRPALTD